MLPLVPSVFGSYAATLFTLIFFYGFLGQAWNIVGGYAGQLSAGHAGFVGVGGYTATVLATPGRLKPWLRLFLRAPLAPPLGAVIGYLCFLLRPGRLYLVLLSLA